ncbi:hypothetical protein SARC_02658 [Sphaeroforma arctica JP610]|uniref:Uncharacterized protein n=1 Tax=Sphaeroforma arctica JP610 TaxID=667725 RepID=A0A0L0G8A2_9EUKA|nr:hypothetical protein SARC_02658 [Sphaeroforma arctica JP610]KNC85134.1 hypothetical protein SARC_02658 [Sphaeroforma arctica JP610]|eukprot:XP_014159036.1 hypothetical protein SARC_02658 [Sphaeroforma arctica JP610]
MGSIDYRIADILLDVDTQLRLTYRQAPPGILQSLVLYHRMIMMLATTVVRIMSCLAMHIFSELLLYALQFVKEPISLLSDLNYHRSHKKVAFRRRVSIVRTYSANEYDRTGSGRLHLSPGDMDEVQTFLEDFKKYEMDVL